MITKVNLSNWKTQKEILVELNREWGLNVSSRTWRMAVERWNMKFAENYKKKNNSEENQKNYANNI